MTDIANIEILITKNSLVSKLSLIAEISKVKITVLVSLSTALGYILAAQNISITLFYSVFGIFLIACSASALNQYQESDKDNLMGRTKNRPIPSGRASENFVFNASMFFLISGSVVLYFLVNFDCLFIALLTMLWYNAVYTPLKRKWAYAIIPGSLVGALPPIAGWVGAGGSWSDIHIYFVALYFFIWQIPHFWLLFILYGKEYQSAGFPVPENLLSGNKFKGIIFKLNIITICMTIILAFSGIMHSGIGVVILISLSYVLLYNSIEFLKSDTNRKNTVKMFVKINMHTLLLIIFLSFDKLINIF